MKPILFVLTLGVCMAGFCPSLSAQEKKPAEATTFIQVEEMPEFPGGEAALRDFLVKNITYPEQARKDTIQGKVYVTFVVDATGKVVEPKVIRGVHPLLDQEALRVTERMPAWKPGKQKGVPVRVSYTLPVMFSLK
ncbi:MAG TPA: energy transducer TonB [Prolixibacteraceae bacterium]|nr:energy transducer TonB [Bacteroidales bacterium]HPJ79271.1 energy transducer TonB [Prolixibacteraceae bacterium]HRV89750.1 energy transducer TonB [Prolixibacteraceae bacterium]